LSNKDELAMAKTDADKFSEVMKVKDDEITFLRGHVK
jgi:hypothetical protein